MYTSHDNGHTWTEKQRLVSSDGTGTDQFGRMLSIDKATIVVGAHGDVNEKGASAGEFDYVGLSYYFVGCNESCVVQGLFMCLLCMAMECGVRTKNCWH